MILIVDDEPGVLRLCQRLLERAGYVVLTASGSEEAMAMLKSQSVELLLADIRMPGVGGFQLMDSARQIHPDLSVVLMTGFGTVDVAIEALHRGADGLILKPFDGTELVQGVKRAYQDNQRRQDSIRLGILQPLFDVTERFFSETHPETLVNLILDAICERLSASTAGLWKCENDGSTNSITCVKLTPPDAEVQQVLDGLVAYVAGRGETLNLDLIALTEELPEGIAQGLADGVLQYFLCIPLIRNGSGLIFVVGRAKSELPFREIDHEMLGILGREAAAAIENARLYTELRKSVEKLEVSQKALLQAEKIATAGRLTASIAHEINNPLQALGNCLELAGRSELATETRENYLQVAKTELDRLMSTVQRMLDLYRPGAKERQWTRPDQIIYRVLKLLEPQMKGNHIQVNFQIMPDPPLVLVVPSQIQQVVLNLLLNAVEAMQDGGGITVQLYESLGHVEIIIGDTGPGIPENAQAHLFEAFNSSKPSGIGLGLAVSYGIIQAHGGSLELLPDYSKGACFRIQLPKGSIP